jgi:hypothetical protein
MHGETVLAIESYRLCGQLLFTRNRIELTIHAWKKALELAEVAPPDVASASSAPVVARTLAEACRKHGLKKQAESFEAQAAAFEAPPSLPTEPPVVPAAPAPQPAAKPKRETIAVTMNMLIEELFPPGDPQYKDFWEPPAEAGQLLTERPKKRDLEPTINFNVGQMSFKSSFVGGLMSFQPSLAGGGGGDLFSPVDMSQFKREDGYERTMPLPDDPAASAEKWKHDPMPSKPLPVTIKRLRRLDPMAMTVFDPGVAMTEWAKAESVPPQRSKELDTIVGPPGLEEEEKPDGDTGEGGPG